MNGTIPRPNMRQTTVHPLDEHERAMAEPTDDGDEIRGGRVLIVIAVGCFLVGVSLVLILVVKAIWR